MSTDWSRTGSSFWSCLGTGLRVFAAAEQTRSRRSSRQRRLATAEELGVVEEEAESLLVELAGGGEELAGSSRWRSSFLADRV